MKIGVLKESHPDERRVALAPESVKKLVDRGVTVLIETGAGLRAHFDDASYIAAGATVRGDVSAVLPECDFLLCVQPPGASHIEQLRDGAYLLGALTPMRNRDVVRQLAQHRITAFSIDLIPRTTRAQSMDTLSSMANIAGYKAAIIAADHCAKYFPMFMTAAGTVPAARCFVIGAGVAGLQAIATAKRLGATVYANDTRSVTKEQVESLGGRFVAIDAEDAQTASGYAKELSEADKLKQATLVAEQCAAADAVITTALIGGVFAPKLITTDTVKRMKPGSVIVDLAAEAGGNCELSQPGKTVVEHGVTIAAPLNLPSAMPYHGSLLFGRNLTTFLLEFIKDGEFQFKRDDDILAGALLTHQGEVTNERVKQALAEKSA